MPPHRAARAEDAVDRWLATLLCRRGWVPRVVPYMGYGAAGEDGWVRVLARVLLVPPGQPRPPREGARGWRRFLAATLNDAPVTVTVQGAVHEVRSGRGGYVDVTVPATPEPGWLDVTLATGGGPPVRAATRVVGSDETAGVVSDIDDTVMITALPRPLLAFWNTFVVRETHRRPVPGMAQLLWRLAGDGPVVYLSTGPWNVAPALERFLHRHGYPPGPLLMTDWGPTADRWFRSGRAHKRSSLRRLLIDLPQLRWALVGDDGQHDPAIYAELVEHAPDRVRLVAIRQLTPTEQVLTHGSPLPPNGQAEPTGAAAAVPVLRGPDGHALLDQLDGPEPAGDRPADMAR